MQSFRLSALRENITEIVKLWIQITIHNLQFVFRLLFMSIQSILPSLRRVPTQNHLHFCSIYFYSFQLNSTFSQLDVFVLIGNIQWWLKSSAWTKNVPLFPQVWVVLYVLFGLFGMITMLLLMPAMCRASKTYCPNLDRVSLKSLTTFITITIIITTIKKSPETSL